MAAMRNQLPFGTRSENLCGFDCELQSYCLGHGNEGGKPGVSANRQRALHSLALNARCLGYLGEAASGFGDATQGDQEHARLVVSSSNAARRYSAANSRLSRSSRIVALWWDTLALRFMVSPLSERIFGFGCGLGGSSEKLHKSFAGGLPCPLLEKIGRSFHDADFFGNRHRDPLV
jgi:hypothetical protein